MSHPAQKAGELATIVGGALGELADFLDKIPGGRVKAKVVPASAPATLRSVGGAIAAAPVVIAEGARVLSEADARYDASETKKIVDHFKRKGIVTNEPPPAHRQRAGGK